MIPKRRRKQVAIGGHTSEVGRVGKQRTVQVVGKKETSLQDLNLLTTLHKYNDPLPCL